jgi:hypothetical protein
MQTCPRILLVLVDITDLVDHLVWYSQDSWSLGGSSGLGQMVQQDLFSFLESHGNGQAIIVGINPFPVHLQVFMGVM